MVLPWRLLLVLCIALHLMIGLFTSCTIVPNVLPLSSDDIRLVARYGWGGRYVIRWATSIVEVYDTTGHPRLPEVIHRWNEVHGEWLRFRLTDNPTSPLRVSYDPELGRDGYCGLAAIWRDAENRIIRSEVRVNPEPGCQDPFLILLHEFGHAAGFRGHTTDGSVMDVPVITEVITGTIVRFFESLGRLSPGEVLTAVSLPPTVSIDGLWRGRMASEAMPETTVTFHLRQRGSRVEGRFAAENGMAGNVTGSLSGEVLLFELGSADPACSEPLIGLANFFDETMLFSFSGRDCLGEHPDGLGRAERP
ncbi:MAG TPA: hypothetical protein VLH40_10005 [Atribacteraceae bacterium]|nr:hypothetical protein [Atribacteraceae bacterium]